MTDRVSVQSTLPDVTIEAASPTPLQAQLIEVNAKPKAAEAAPEKPQSGDKLFNEVFAIKPTDIGQGFQDAQAAAKAFMTVPDTAEALTKTAPAFEAAIKKSDSEYISTIAKFSPDYNLAKRAVGESQFTAMEASMGLKSAFANIPDDKKQEVQQIMSLLTGEAASPALKTSLHKELEKYPEFVKNFDKTDAAMKVVETNTVKLLKAAEPMIHASREEAATRFIYAHAMELAGDGGKAVLLKQEGMSKITDAATEFLHAPKPPEHILRA